MEKLLDEFIQYKPQRSINTNKQYAHRIQKIVKENDDNVDILDDFSGFQEYLKTYKSTTRSNVYTSLIDYHQMKNSDPILIESLQKEHSATMEIYKQKQNSGTYMESQKENKISLTQLQGYMTLLENIVSKFKYEFIKNPADRYPAIDYLNLRLMLKLLLLYPSRNEYSSLEIIKLKDYEKIEPNTMPWYKNYLIYKGRPKIYYLHIADYKTFSNYGLKKHQIKDTKS